MNGVLTGDDDRPIAFTSLKSGSGPNWIEKNVDYVVRGLEKLRNEDSNMSFIITVYEAMFILDHKPSLQQIAILVDRLASRDSSIFEAGLSRYVFRRVQKKLIQMNKSNH